MRTQLRLFLLTAGVLILPTVAYAQSLQGFAFGGVAALAPEGEGLVQVGAGLERIFGRGITAGVEFGWTGNSDPYRRYTHVSLDGGYHVPTKNRRFDPFVSGGFTMLVDWDGAVGMFNVGGGVTYWTRPRLGLRVEARNHIYPGYNGLVQLPSFRIGVTVR